MKKINEYSQHMEIKTEDMLWVLEALTKVGYECVGSQDDVCTDIISIDFIHPEWDGYSFTDMTL